MLELRLCAVAAASVPVYECEAWPVSDKVYCWSELGTQEDLRLSQMIIELPLLTLWPGSEQSVTVWSTKDNNID